MICELEVINMITSGNIPEMSTEEREQMEKDLLVINEWQEEKCHCPLDITKKFKHHFPGSISKKIEDIQNHQ